ncbi:hypothetical protein HHI36_016937 [Cryptolaemus montrouzieri]|uniref:Uncharacterized protein n=1 Tax=Cryptolaemus montrouzieri TaxID=559131 RepID=A0ABD2NL46_9CUCU
MGTQCSTSDQDSKDFQFDVFISMIVPLSSLKILNLAIQRKKIWNNQYSLIRVSRIRLRGTWLRNDSTESSNINNESDPDFVFYSDASDESLKSTDQSLAENASSVAGMMKLKSDINQQQRLSIWVLKSNCNTIRTEKKKVFGSVIAKEAEADLKVLIRLIESHWRFEVSSQAAIDLGMQKWYKITLVIDVKKLRDYLIRRAHSAIDELRNNSESISAYRTQRLPLHIYENCETNSQNYEWFLDIV